MRSIAAFGDGATGWQMLAAEDDGFEEQALRACELVLTGDARIGKVSKARRPRGLARRAEPPGGSRRGKR
jgi:hypothetical protein